MKDIGFKGTPNTRGGGHHLLSYKGVFVRGMETDKCQSDALLPLEMSGCRGFRRDTGGRIKEDDLALTHRECRIVPNMVSLNSMASLHQHPTASLPLRRMGKTTSHNHSSSHNMVLLHSRAVISMASQ